MGSLADKRVPGFVVKLLTGDSLKGGFHAAGAQAAPDKLAALIVQFALPPERFPR